MNAPLVKTPILAALLACAGTFGPAFAVHAGEDSVAQARHADVVVRFGDLNLETDAGARVLYARLSRAAERACGDEPSVRQFRERAEFKACYDRSLAKAVGKVGHRSVEALHAANRKEGRQVG